MVETQYVNFKPKRCEFKDISTAQLLLLQFAFYGKEY